MRLIDADVLLDVLEKLFKRRELNAACTGNRGSFVTWNDAICAIKDAPTVQPTQANTLKALETLDCVNRQAAIAKDMNVPSTDCISRQQAIDALWKALFEYEDKTEKQFQESEELDVGDWFAHRIFVQNMSDIDRQTILNLPAAQPETAKRIVGKSRGGMTLWYQCDMCNEPVDAQDNFCCGCGRRLIDG